MNEEVNKWLSNPNKDYFAGVDLLDKYGTNPHLARIYRKKSPKFNMANLIYEVSRLINLQKIEAKIVLKTPEIILTAQKKAHSAWVEMSKLTNEIYDLGTLNDDDHVNKRRELLELKSQYAVIYDELWRCIAIYKETKKVPPELTDIVKLDEKKKNLSKIQLITITNSVKSQLKNLFSSKNQLVKK